jgi:hypothetical protein
VTLNLIGLSPFLVLSRIKYEFLGPMVSRKLFVVDIVSRSQDKVGRY